MRIPPLTLAIICALPAGALGQPAPTPQTPPADLPPAPAKPKTEVIEVTERASRYDARREETATKIVVTAAEIMKFGDTQVADILKRLPGITVQGNDIRMRGLGGGYTQILLDGQRPPPGFALDQLPPAEIERIEIIRAATADMSAAGIAGTINIVLKQRASKRSREVRLNLRRGTGVQQVSTNLQMADRLNDFSYTLNVELFRNEINFPGTEEQSVFDSNGRLTNLFVTTGQYPGTTKRLVLTPRLNWKLGGGDSFSLNSAFTFARAHFAPDYTGVALFGTAPTVARGTGVDTRSRFLARIDGNWITTLQSGLKIDTKLGVRGGPWRKNESQLGSSTSRLLTLDRTIQNDERTVELTSSAKFFVPPIGRGHSWSGGWDVGTLSERLDSRRTERPTSVNPASAVNYFGTTRVDRAALFVQDDWTISERWQTYGGLRWESVSTSVSANSVTASGRYAVVSPIFQNLWKLPDTSKQVRVALTRSFKAPSTDQLGPVTYVSNNNTPIEPDYSGNPKLRPELSTGVDVAFEKFWDPNGSVSLSLALRRLRDLQSQAVALSNGRWVSTPINNGNAAVASLEFDTKFPVQSVWKNAPPIDFRFNASVNRSRVDTVPGPNNVLSSQTPYSASVGLDYRVKGGVFVTGGSLTIRGGQEVRSTTNQYSKGRRNRDLEVYGAWKPSPVSTLRMTAGNLFKDRSVDESRYFDATGTRRNIYTAPTRVFFRLTYEYKF